MAINNVRQKLAEGGGIARCGVRKALCVNQGEIKLFCSPCSPFAIRKTLMLWIGTVPVRSAHPTPAPGFTIPGRHEYQSAWSSKSGKVMEKIERSERVFKRIDGNHRFVASLIGVSSIKISPDDLDASCFCNSSGNWVYFDPKSLIPLI